MDILHILEHSFFESFNLFPFLFLAYLFLEYLEHKSQEKIVNTIQKTSKFGPLLGGFLGLFPHCGFSAIASSFYATRVITLGTLFAVYIATSDEMIPIFLLDLLYRYFGIVVDINDGKIVDLHIEREGAKWI